MAINEKLNSGQFVKVKVRAQGSDTFKFIFACVDTGNRARNSIIDEKIFKVLAPNGLIDKIDTELVGPNDSLLETLGRSKNNLEMVFYNKNGEKLTYQLRPIVVKGLQLPFTAWTIKFVHGERPRGNGPGAVPPNSNIEGRGIGPTIRGNGPSPQYYY